MKKIQRGFTLIELVIVIVLVGILAAVAIPKFVDMKTQASTAAAKGVAASLASASAINFAGSKMGTTTLVTDCTSTGVALLLRETPVGFTFTGSTGGPCTVTQTDGGGTAVWNLSN